MSERGRLARTDRGSVLLLGLGLVVVCIVALTVLVDVSAALLQRQRLLALADAAALAGAQAVDLAAYYEEGASSATRLDGDAVDAAARRYIAASDAPASIDGLRIERIWTDGRQVLVALSSPLRLPFLPDLADGQLRVEAWAQLAYRD